MKETLAIIGGLIGTFSTVPYLIDIVRGKTKPNVVSWSTWALLLGIATAAAFASNSPRTAYLTLGDTFCVFLVVVLGFKYGIAKMTLFDGICQAAAILGLILWLVLNSPAIALAFSLIIDFVVSLPTIRHSWISPAEETWQTFGIGVLAASFTLVSLASYTFSDLAFPIYLWFGNAVIGAVIIYRRKQKGLTLAR